MGGKEWFYVPKVWAPSGGWWCNPPQWRRNTAIGMAIIAGMSVFVFKLSASLERRPIPPLWHIPSQMWCKHALEDDPSLANKK